MYPDIQTGSATKCVKVLWGNVKFIDVPAGQEVKVDNLIGLDDYWKFITPEMVSLSEGLVYQRSMFGWVLSGTVPASFTPIVLHMFQSPV